MRHKIKALLTVFVLILSLPEAYAEEWTIRSGFEAFEVGEKALGSSGFWGGAGQTEVVEEPNLKGKAAKIWINKNQTGYGRWGGEWNFKEKLYKGDTVWFSAHIYVPEDFDPHAHKGGKRLKFLRIATRGPDHENHGFNDLYVNMKESFAPFRWIYEGQQKWSDVGVPKDGIQKERWENYQMSITFDSVPKIEGGLAEVHIWKDGKQIAHITDRKTLKTPDDYAHRALLFTYWNGGAIQKQHMYVDEIVITNTKPSWADINNNPLVAYYTDLCRMPE